MTILFRERVGVLDRLQCDGERRRCTKPAGWTWRVGPVEVSFCSWHDLGERLAQEVAKNEVLTINPNLEGHT